jgi:hypothetical protein
VPDLTAFPELPALRFFEAWQVRGLADLRPGRSITHAEGAPPGEPAPRHVPGFSQAAFLGHVRIDNLR